MQFSGASAKKKISDGGFLLCDTELSIEEIALDVGYENQSYFFRQFKKRYGMTPHKYRKENIKDKKR